MEEDIQNNPEVENIEDMTDLIESEDFIDAGTDSIKISNESSLLYKLYFIL